MKKTVLVMAGIFFVVLMGCDLKIGVTTTTSTTTTTTVPVKQYRITNFQYTWITYTNGNQSIAQQYTDTYHYPSASTNRYTSRDRLYSTSNSFPHQLIQYSRDSLGRLVLREYYDANVTPNTLLRSNKYSYNNDEDWNYSQITYFNATGNMTSYYVYNYDDQKRLVGETSCVPGRNFPSYEYCYYYDANSYMIRCVYTNYNTSGQANAQTLYVLDTLDSVGRLVERKFYTSVAMTPSTMEEEDTFTYDADGNEINMQYIYYNQGTLSSKDVYEYEYEEY